MDRVRSDALLRVQEITAPEERVERVRLRDVMGVGQAQVWNDRSVIRQPAFAVAAYALLLLAGLKAYGGERSSELPALPRWRGHAGRPSCLDLVNTLRGQLDGRADLFAEWGGSFGLVHAVEQAAA